MDALLYFSIIRDAGAKAGIAIDLDTAVESVDRKLLDACDFVLILSVHAGKSGQAFDARALKKAQTVRKMCPNVCLILDGGINASNIDTVRAAGVDVAGVGSFIYNMPTQTQRAQAVAALSGI
jgi:ribulose-phosphate 3-epimerase